MALPSGQFEWPAARRSLQLGPPWVGDRAASYPRRLGDIIAGDRKPQCYPHLMFGSHQGAGRLATARQGQGRSASCGARRGYEALKCQRPRRGSGAYRRLWEAPPVGLRKWEDREEEGAQWSIPGLLSLPTRMQGYCEYRSLSAHESPEAIAPQ
jgi:hypothetical protein